MSSGRRGRGRPERVPERVLARPSVSPLLAAVTLSVPGPDHATASQPFGNLLFAQANSASYPPWDGKWVVAYALRGAGLVRLIGAMVCLLAANRGSNCSLTRAMNGPILRCGIISSSQSAAISKIVKALLVLSPSHVWSAIASTGLYLF